ncbi:hypothetical protein, no similarity [Maudiozyma saulgeensis]|uniref:Uncharacterized protein n=1 Tax=Maudiozyma saulgeensis TaxID=1789683 RepID=A0A1X7R1R1_9SACH|nr:hypothetical protein, no similarity [Kazachstania saulgeensis]
MNFSAELETQQIPSGLWSWYLSNLKEGTFEQIVGNEHRLNRIKKENTLSAVNVIISVPENLVSPDTVNILTESFEKYIPDNIVIDLNEITTTNEHLYFIRDTYNKFVYKFRLESIKIDILPLLKPSQLQLNSQQPSPPISDESDNSHIAMENNTERIIDDIKNEMIAVSENSDYSEDTEDEDSGAIILNFTRKSRSGSRPNFDRDDLFTPVESEVISISSLENSTTMETDLSRLEECISLRRIAANNGSSILDKVISTNDIDLKLVGAVCRDGRELDSFSTAIRQGLGEDWVLYDNDFHLNNLEYCSMEEVLYGDREVTTLIFTINPTLG